MKKKIILQITLWVGSLIFGYQIYSSINGPIFFNKIKVKRYAAAIDRLKMVKEAEEAFMTITGTYSSNFDELSKFIDTAKFTITEQRDTSWMAYDKVYRIDVLKQGVVIDTLGSVNVRDSLFGGTDIYKDMRYIPGTDDKEFELSSSMIKKAGYRIPVFEASVAKKYLLADQPQELVKQEEEAIGVDEIDGPLITVGSLTEVSTNGNWPSLYDSKNKK